MGMSWSDYLGIGLQGGGAVAGGIFGGPAGAGTGAGLGGAIAGGLSLLDKSKQVKMPGMTPEQEKALFYQGQIASKAMAQDGISSQTASRVTQAGRETALSDIAEANTFGRRLSPLDRAMLVKQLTERSQKTQSQLMDNLMAYAEGRETQALGIAGQASKNLMDSATEMERARTLKFEKELTARQAQFEQYTKSISALAGTMTNTIFDVGKKPETQATKGTISTAPATQAQPKTTIAQAGQSVSTPEKTSLKRDLLFKNLINAGYTEEQAKHFSNASSGYGESLLAEEYTSEESLFSLGNQDANPNVAVGDLLGILRNAGILK